MQCEDCSFNVLGRSWGFLSVVVEGAGLVYVVEFVCFRLHLESAGGCTRNAVCTCVCEMNAR